MLSPFQSFVGMMKRYYRKPKSIEFYWNVLGFTTFVGVTSYFFLDQELYNNIFNSLDKPKNSKEGEGGGEVNQINSK